MRHAIFISLFMLAACTDRSLGGPGIDVESPNDFAVSPHDFSTRPVDASTTNIDLAVQSGESCLEIVVCAQSCGGFDGSCFEACIAAGTPAAQTAVNALIVCAYTECLSTNGPAHCTSMTDTSTACAQCLAAAAQSSACSTELNACLSQ